MSKFDAAYKDLSRAAESFRDAVFVAWSCDASTYEVAVQKLKDIRVCLAIVEGAVDDFHLAVIATHRKRPHEHAPALDTATSPQEPTKADE